MNVLIVSEDTLDMDTLKRDTGLEVAHNQQIEGGITIVDLAHEDSVEERWADEILMVGDLTSKFKPRVSLKVPTDGATRQIVEYLSALLEDEDVEETESDTDIV